MAKEKNEGQAPETAANTAQIAELNAKVEELEKQNAELTAKLTEQVKLNGELEAQVGTLGKEGATREETVKELLAQLENSELERETGKPIVKVFKVDHIIVMKAVRFKGQVVTAEDVKNNKKLAEELVKAGSGMLVKLEA